MEIIVKEDHYHLIDELGFHYKTYYEDIDFPRIFTPQEYLDYLTDVQDMTHQEIYYFLKAYI